MAMYWQYQRNLGRKQGVRVGLKRGLEKGIEKGIEQGRENGMREMLMGLLQRRFTKLPRNLSQRLEDAEPEQLMRWLHRALEVRTAAAVFREAR